MSSLEDTMPAFASARACALLAANSLDSDGAAAEVSIGVGLARKLHLKVGDNVTLLTTYGQNAVNAVDADIVGIFESGVEAVDALAVTIPI